MSVDRRREMVGPAHPSLSISAQCRLVAISRSSFYYTPQPEAEETLALMRVIDAAFPDMPWCGSRQMARHLRRLGHGAGRRRVRRLMAGMGLSPIYQRPRTSDRHPQHRVCPYLLRDLGVQLLNTDQGGPFTSFAFTAVLKDASVRISMDGRGRWMDTVFIERLWRFLKHEYVHLHAFETGSDLRVGLTRWIGHYTVHRPHAGLAGRTPDEACGIHETAPGVGLAPPPASLQMAA